MWACVGVRARALSFGAIKRCGSGLQGLSECTEISSAGPAHEASQTVSLLFICFLLERKERGKTRDAGRRRDWREPHMVCMRTNVCVCVWMETGRKKKKNKPPVYTLNSVTGDHQQLAQHTAARETHSKHGLNGGELFSQIYILFFKKRAFWKVRYFSFGSGLGTRLGPAPRLSAPNYTRSHVKLRWT